ncbi:MAG: enolase C-terminal domain-like protein [Anaerolineae bacterium]
MKIRSIECLQRVVPPTEATIQGVRRPGWAEQAEVANPMSKFPEFKSHRRLWMPDWPNFWVRATAEDGTYGLAPCSFGRVTAAIITDHYSRIVVGQDAMAIERAWDLMFRMSKPYGTVGLASVAMSGVDLALWDLAGKLTGRPVYELLGGKLRDRIFAYATGNDVDWYAELGFRAFKLACPYGPADGLWGLQQNERFVAAARETIGPDAELMLDCYMAFDVDYTVRLAERLRPYGLKWIEEYLIPEDMDGHVAVRERLPWQTLATGEHLYTPWPFKQLIERRAVDILQPDMNWVGGLTACRRIAEMADTAGLTVMLHGGGMTPYGTHLTCSMPNMPWGEYFVGTAPGVQLESAPSVPGASIPKDGWITIADAPGFGVDIPAEQLAPFAQ